MEGALGSPSTLHAAGHAVMSHLTGRPLSTVAAGTHGCEEVWPRRSNGRHAAVDLMVVAAGTIAEVQHCPERVPILAGVDDAVIGLIVDRHGGWTSQWAVSLHLAVHAILRRPQNAAAVRIIAGTLSERAVSGYEVAAVVDTCTITFRSGAGGSADQFG